MGKGCREDRAGSREEYYSLLPNSPFSKQFAGQPRHVPARYERSFFFSAAVQLIICSRASPVIR